MNTVPTRRRRRLAWALSITFLLAMVMGPGPGLYLVNPAPDAPRESYLLWGMPIVYVWGLFWYVVQVVVIVTAYICIWRRDEPREAAGG